MKMKMKLLLSTIIAISQTAFSSEISVVGMSRIDAIVEIENLGLYYQIFERTICSEQDIVLETNPKGNLSSLPEGSTVFIFVSNGGTRHIIPKTLIGLSYSEAEAALVAKNLVAIDAYPKKKWNTRVVGVCNYDDIEALDPIQSTEPPPDTEVCIGTEITLYQTLKKTSRALPIKFCP